VNVAPAAGTPLLEALQLAGLVLRPVPVQLAFDPPERKYSPSMLGKAIPRIIRSPKSSTLLEVMMEPRKTKRRNSPR
jgi:hypothetical protein